MTYAQFGLIQATDFNTFVGGDPTTTANTLNATWATGGNNAGYGQTAVANVTAGNQVQATSWASLINNINSAFQHQTATSNTGLTAPVAGGVVQYLANIQTSLNNIYANRGNAVAQGSTTANTQTTAGAWTDYANFAFTCQFANGDAARYFFNAGGQIKLTCTHPNTTAGINAALNTLATATGTVVISGQNSGARQIAGSSFNGITKVGGSGTPDTVATNSGYFGLNTANTLIFDQNSGTAPYTANVQILMYARTTTANISGNGDNGGNVLINLVMDKVSGNGTLGSGGTATCTVVPPSIGNISNTWGAITLTGSNAVA